MNFFRTVTAIALLTTVASLGFAQETKKPTTDKDKASYALGQNLGRMVLRDGLDGKILDTDFIAKGMVDVMLKTDPLLSQAEQAKAMEAYAKIIKEYVAKKQEACVI